MPAIGKQQQKRSEQGRKNKAVTGAATNGKLKGGIAGSKRTVIYDKHTAVIHDGVEAPAITAAQAKEILGWEEEGEKNPFGKKYLTEINGKKVRCNNNVTNRPLGMAVVETLVQEILNKRWSYNGESIIIGRTGLVLNGQHTLLALIIAAQRWHDNPEACPLWKEEPTLHKLIAYGVKEDDQTVNTMDTCKPRSFADVLYRAQLFKDLTSEQRKNATKILGGAVRMLWHRVEPHSNALSKYRTHSEVFAFFERHPSLIKATQHVWEENADQENKNKLSKWLALSYCATCMYLMGTSGSNPEKYYTSDEPSEKHLDLSRWDRASEFFVELAGGADSVRAVRNAIGSLAEASAYERMAIIAKAWKAYQQKKPVTAKVELKTHLTEDGNRIMDENPVFGGVDVGDEGLGFAANGDPGKEEIKNGTKEVKDKKFGKSKEAKRAGDSWAAGDSAWVHDPQSGSDPYFATLTVDPYDCADGTRMVMVDAEDGNWEVNADWLSLKQYEKV